MYLHKGFLVRSAIGPSFLLTPTQFTRSAARISQPKRSRRRVHTREVHSGGGGSNSRQSELRTAALRRTVYSRRHSSYGAANPSALILLIFLLLHPAPSHAYSTSRLLPRPTAPDTTVVRTPARVPGQLLQETPGQPRRALASIRRAMGLGEGWQELASRGRNMRPPGTVP
jgi:hypothetical protein